jgi:hypothetical protein
VGIRIIAPDPTSVKVVRDESDGSILFIPVGSAYALKIGMEAVEFPPDSDEPLPDVLDTRHAAVRPSAQTKVKKIRRTLRFTEE